MLDTFTKSTFSKHLGETFRVHTEASDVLEFELTEVKSLGSGAPSAEKREPFSILFNSPGETVLPQKIYRIEHDTLGTFDLFIVPVNQDREGVQYEAVFT
jgi:hypothetical protein